MYFYNKAFWKRYNSARIAVIRNDETFMRAGLLTEDIQGQYIEAMEEDISWFFMWYKKFATFQDGSVVSRMPFDYQLSGKITLDAWTWFNEEETATDIFLSAGLSFTLFDLMTRICCNKAVLSTEAVSMQRVWDGTTCLWLQSSSIPEIRFSNYQPSNNAAFTKEPGSAADNYLGAFLCGVPVGDEDRLYLASLMEFISTTWILFHEEAHYWQGHIHYLIETDALTLSETESEAQYAPLLKIFEWQADRGAIVDLMNMFFLGIDEAPFELPAMFQGGNDLSWYIRIIITALGSTIMSLQKTKLIYQTESHYPSPETRFSTVLGIIYSRLMTGLETSGQVLGVSDKGELEGIILSSYYAALNDLMNIEEIFTNQVDYDGPQRVHFERVNPESLMYIEDTSDIPKIITGLLAGLKSDDAHIQEKWFAEYLQILQDFEPVFRELLPPYRDMTTINNSPYNDYRNS
jgi:hypothetical protein